jgi:hypothetical protein
VNVIRIGELEIAYERAGSGPGEFTVIAWDEPGAGR